LILVKGEQDRSAHGNVRRGRNWRKGGLYVGCSGIARAKSEDTDPSLTRLVSAQNGGPDQDRLVLAHRSASPSTIQLLRIEEELGSNAVYGKGTLKNKRTVSMAAHRFLEFLPAFPLKKDRARREYWADAGPDHPGPAIVHRVTGGWWGGCFS